MLRVNVKGGNRVRVRVKGILRVRVGIWVMCVRVRVYVF
jgi:hypothetical protein